MPVNVKFTRERKDVFLEQLAKRNQINFASRCAGVTVTTIYTHRRKDPEFAAEMELARERFCEDVIDEEMHIRGVEGRQRKVIQNGEVVDIITERSDRIFEIYAKANSKKYRDHKSVDMNVNAGVLIVPEVITDTKKWEEQVEAASKD